MAKAKDNTLIYLKESVDETFQSFNITDFQKYKILKGQVSFNGNYIVSMVGFVGEMTGMISIYCSRQMALQIATSMMGLQMEEIDQDVRDAVGEIANIVVGIFKAKFGTDHTPFQQSVPSVLDGHNFTSNNFDGQSNRLFAFESKAGTVYIQLLLKT